MEASKPAQASLNPFENVSPTSNGTTNKIVTEALVTATNGEKKSQPSEKTVEAKDTLTVESTEPASTGFKVVDRILSVALIQKVVVTITMVAGKLRDRGGVARWAVESSEKLGGVAASGVNLFRGHLLRADSLASNGLDWIEDKLTILLSYPKQVYKVVLQKKSEIIDGAVQRFSAVVKFTSDSFNQALETRPAKFVLVGLEKIVSAVENFADSYLPKISPSQDRTLFDRINVFVWTLPSRVWIALNCRDNFEEVVRAQEVTPNNPTSKAKNGSASGLGGRIPSDETD